MRGVFEDLSGRTFGFWVVTGPHKGARGRSIWPCRCECGVERYVDSHALRQGGSKGCRRCSGRHRLVDLSGQTFGSWTVLRRSETRHKTVYFLCRCSCGAEKDVSSSNLSGGGSARCVRCVARGNMGDNNPSRRKAVVRNGGRPVLCGTPEYQAAASCSDRAKKRGLAFGFSTLSECAQWIRDNTPEKCPVFGTPLARGNVRQGFRDDAPSVDRIDSTKGYTPDNMQVISMRANSMKSDATAEELRQFAAWVLRG